MSKAKVSQSMDNLENAIDRLQEALQVENPNQLMIDGTIQRFEFVLELFWKTLKRLLEIEGIRSESPKSTLREAYQIGWLHDDAAWLRMLRDRNLTSHVYDEEIALKIYRDIQHYFPELQRVFQERKAQFMKLP